ncbi:amino acid permease 4-like, partial [Camellia sinensis]|uniref:amino acid permease 4-like n=1 Tax=Camellia sinensis TaxID=4442 RepID=UPI001035AD67
MSFIYSFIALALGLVKVTGDGVIKGNIAGVSTSTTLEKVWLVSEALGDIAFAYPYSIILIEIQVFSQPLFALVDKWFARKFPNSGFVNYDYTLKLPFFLILRLNLLRLCFRTTYVASTTVIAMIFPYFNQVL